MTALLQAREADGEQDANGIDHKLVAAVRRGDDRAFEGLYERYQRRIHAYVLGMVKDHQRAEDVTQEVFVSALRRMRATERPIAFKPWIYEIAKNACIDAFRRSRRAEEVSFDADDGLAPSDYGRLVSAEPIPDDALLSKQSLNDLCGAFGGLSDAHHEILVLRELEGMSYRDIGERMGMSRPAVESTLFRARRRLTEEYDELASGQRCVRIQAIISTAGGGRLGARDTRRLAHHVAHCQPCRREAVAAGVDSALVAPRPLRERAAAKIAGLFPFPPLLRFRRGGGGSGGDTGGSWVQQLPMVSDQASAGVAKAVAAGALLVAGLGGGVSSDHGSGPRDREAAPPAVRSSESRPAVASPAKAGASSVVPAGRSTLGNGSRRTTEGARTRGGRPGTGARSALGSTRSPGAAGKTGAGAPAAGQPAARQDGGGGGQAGGGDRPSSGRANGANGRLPAGRKPPMASLPTGSVDPAGAVEQATGAVGGVVEQTTGAVGGVVEETTGAVGGVVEETTGAVGGVVEQTTGAVGGVVDHTTGTVGGVLQPLTGGVDDATSGATAPVTGAVDDVAGSLLTLP